MTNRLLTLTPNNGVFTAHHHCTNPSGSLFGGQVLGQSLIAASHEINLKERFLHSLHAYFINRGDSHSPVDYAVDTLREGRSFTAMNVVASQNDKEIFIANLSLQKPEHKGFSHVPAPIDMSLPTDEDFQRMVEYAEAAKTDPKFAFFTPHYNVFFQMVTTKENPMMLYQDGSPSSEFWIKASEQLDADDLAKHQACLLAASDMGILFSTIAPYRVDIRKTQFASIDHSIWLHNPHINMNDWHFIRANSVWAGNSRSLVKAEIYNSAGELVASVAQEGLVRAQLL